jgi:hypothetical protein
VVTFTAMLACSLMVHADGESASSVAGMTSAENAETCSGVTVPCTVMVFGEFRSTDLPIAGYSDETFASSPGRSSKAEVRLTCDRFWTPISPASQHSPPNGECTVKSLVITPQAGMFGEEIERLLAVASPESVVCSVREMWLNALTFPRDWTRLISVCTVQSLSTSMKPDCAVAIATRAGKSVQLAVPGGFGLGRSQLAQFVVRFVLSSLGTPVELGLTEILQDAVHVVATVCNRVEVPEGMNCSFRVQCAPIRPLS